MSAKDDVDVAIDARIDNATNFTVCVVAAAVLSGHLEILPRKLSGQLHRFRRGLICCCSCSRTRADRQMARAQFLDVREFVEIAEAEMIEKKLRCFVKQRTTRNFGAARNFDEAAFH